MGYVLSGVGAALALLLILIGINGYRTEANNRENVLGRVEVAYVVARNQLSAAGITPSPKAPSLPVLVGPSGIVGDQGAPPLITFMLQTSAGTATLTCKDPTGAGKYTCTTVLQKTSSSTSVPK